MHPLLIALAARLRPEAAAPLLSRQEAIEFVNLPAEASCDMLALAAVARGLFRPDVFTCGIVNAKSGRCPEDCAFCAQSVRYRTGAPVYPLLDADTLLARAAALAEAGALRFGIVTSGTALSDQDLDALCAVAGRLTRETGLGLCGSLGMLTPERAVRLRQAGFTRYHHNLETAASHFAAICTTHAYAEDIASLRAARAAGLEVCSGGILGLGESRAQRVELALTLAGADVDAVPINFLQAIPGTPLAGQLPLPPMEALRGIALFRLLLPRKDVLVCGGRAHVLGAWQSWLFAAGANGLMTGNYLTTRGNTLDADNAMLAGLGLPRQRPGDRA